ncbi:lipopolysaccharide assembly protein LapB [Pleurocapsa sp. PCC 7319]|uniref:tetratricopeptide repeat protein n=1 Tax=Pleurocapsa sp. PCC 7319 TaxID=118161 RepID=UPI000348F17E|nr:tetratricopeptide repeat protein [Pleurocapsa sp. PCC 7319]
MSEQLLILNNNNWKILLLTCFLGISNFVSVQTIAQAQTDLVNPLETIKSDPLIPPGYGQRELTSFEKYRIEKTIIDLNQTATAELAQGNTDQAFKLWYRQLRLTRALDTSAEIKALGKIGAIAWQENRGADVRNIAKRLITIQEEITAKKPLTTALLNQFAQAYQEVGYLDRAIAIYQQILTNNRKTNSSIAEQKNLETLGKLYLARFDYQQAAKIYQELSTVDTFDEQKTKLSNKQKFYLSTLIDIYDRTEQTNKAITTRKRLLKQYSAAQQLNKIPALEMAIAQNYETLNQPDKAIKAYDRVFTMASQTQKLAIASDALTRLGELYQQTKRTDDAIATYAELIEVQQQTYNYYGLVNTYDTLGKIYFNLNQKAKAKLYFQAGLELAKPLDYKVEYFNNQINSTVQ